MLPDGLGTPGMEFLVAVHDERVVGGLWLARRGSDARGRGVGRALMLAAQDRARDLGALAVGLTVFGPNTTARRLYESLGHLVTARQMQLRL